MNTKQYKRTCNFCRDAGKPEREYSSHFVKDKTGKVVCPTLLAVQCPCCGEKGHTAKFCTAEKKEPKTEPKTSNQKYVAPIVIPTARAEKQTYTYKPYTGNWADAESSDDDLEEVSLNSDPYATEDELEEETSLYISLTEKP